jgi:hypothetical protein
MVCAEVEVLVLSFRQVSRSIRPPISREKSASGQTFQAEKTFTHDRMLNHLEGSLPFGEAFPFSPGDSRDSLHIYGIATRISGFSKLGGEHTLWEDHVSIKKRAGVKHGHQDGL